MNSSTIVSKIHPTNLNGTEKTVPVDEGSLETTTEGSQQAATRNRGKAIVNSHLPTYDQEPKMVVNVVGARENVAYHKEKMLLCKQEEVVFQLNAEQERLRDDTDDEPEDQELEAHYLYMAKIQEVTPNDANNSRPIFDIKPLQKLGKFGNDQIAPILGYGDLYKEMAIATACFTQNRSLVIPRHDETPYHIMNGQKLSVKFFYIFGSLCYIVRDGENLDKIKEKDDACIFVGYSTQSRAYRVYNKRTRVIVETIHVNFDELPQMASDHVSSDPVPQSEIVTTSNELDLLFSLMFDELLNGTTPVVSKSSAVTATDAPNQRQQQNTTPSTSTTVAADIPPLNIQTTPETTNQAPTQAPTVTAIENINQAETDKKNAQVEEDEFINIFSTPVQERGETSSRYVDSTRRQLEIDGEMCMFALTVGQTEPKNIKEAMAESAWIGAIKEELHLFDRLDYGN
ncbi:retrovirus-related pol polyprotein from transposon TNT 1-94 [Tanacetum coccineum]